jgi:hypothetical protein
VTLTAPFSGAVPAPRMPPEPAGTLGQWLPPGAGATLLRSVSFFDCAAALSPALILTWWAALGLGAVLVGPALKRSKKPATSQPAAPTTGRTPAPTPAH